MEEDRREKILLKAIELYMIEGYANVSITDLQAALNMGRGTLYYYFKDKDELFQEVVDEFLIKPKQRALDRVKEGAAIPEMIEAMLYYLNQLKDFRRLLIWFCCKVYKSNTRFIILLVLKLIFPLRP